MKSIDFVCNQSVFWPLICNTLLVFVLSPARSWIKILWSWAGCIFAGISILIPPYSNIPLGCWVGGNNRRLLVFFSNCGYFLVDSLKLLTNWSILWFQNKWIQRSLFLSVNLIIDFVIFCLPKETYHLLIQILILWKKIAVLFCLKCWTVCQIYTFLLHTFRSIQIVFTENVLNSWQTWTLSILCSLYLLYLCCLHLHLSSRTGKWYRGTLKS